MACCRVFGILHRKNAMLQILCYHKDNKQKIKTVEGVICKRDDSKQIKLSKQEKMNGQIKQQFFWNFSENVVRLYALRTKRDTEWESEWHRERDEKTNEW